MRLNHVTVTVSDLDRAVDFYKQLGLTQIVSSPPHYARFLCPDGDSTFSLHALGPGKPVPPAGTSVHFECERLDEKVSELEERGLTFDQSPTDQPYLWREAILRDPDGNLIFLFHAGENRLNPPWRLPESR
jgi:catechol 2,3-dioxygenase-like lactoylglutathione lyase family enzyme